MLSKYMRRNWPTALCCLGLMFCSPESYSQSAKSNSKSRGKDGRQIAARQVLNRANALRAELRRRDRTDRPPYSDHRHHLYAHVQAGKEKLALIGSPSGVFPIIIHEADRTVDFNLYIPTIPIGQAAEVFVIDDGTLSPFHRLIGVKSSEADERVRAPSRGKGKAKGKSKGNVNRPDRKRGKKHIVVAAGANGRVNFTFRYGENLHAQRIEIRTPQQRVFFNLHLHPPGYDEH